MQALTYHGRKDVRVETVPDPVLAAEDDLILRVTATAICGSDLHLYRGKIPDLHDGDVLGHEFMGVVEEVGSGVTQVQPGDRVVIPFVIACGVLPLPPGRVCRLRNHQYRQGRRTESEGHAASGRIVRLQPSVWRRGRGQAEFVRVPKANVGPLRIPEGIADEQVLFLSDILPTGYQAALNAGVKAGSTVAIFGAGPVGLMSAACCRLLGAETIFMVDHLRYRLDYARRTYGVTPIDFKEIGDPADYILAQTSGRGVDACIEAVGFEAEGSALESALTAVKLEGSSGVAIRQCIAAARRGGVVSIPGVYAGFIHGFLLGDAFDKGLTFKMGQTHVQD